MFRLVYKPARLGVAALLGGLVFCGVLAAWSVQGGNVRVPELVIALGLGTGMLALLYTFLQGPTLWEVDDFVLRKTVAGTAEITIPLAAIAVLRARRWLSQDSVALEVLDVQGRVTFLLGSTEGVAVADVRALYEAVAFFLKGRNARESNPFGWSAVDPVAQQRRCTGTWLRPRDLAAGLPLALITGGVNLFAVNTGRRLAFDIAGAAFVVTGVVVAAWYVRHYWFARPLGRDP